MTTVVLPELPATRAEAMYAALKQQLVDGVLAPGQRLVIDEIARRSGVSAIPVREALRRLESDGLVRTIPHVGVIVTQATQAELVGDYQVLSGLAARLATPHLEAADFSAISSAIGSIDSCIQEGRLADADPYNLSLHDVITRVCGLVRLRTLIADLWQRSISRHRLFFGLMPGRALSANEEHREILAALEARDGDEAERRMRAHLQHSAENFERFFREHPAPMA